MYKCRGRVVQDNKVCTKICEDTTRGTLRRRDKKCSKTLMARTSLGPRKFIRDMGTCRSSQSVLIMAPGQEANGDNLGKSFRSSTQYVCWVYSWSLESPRYNIRFHDKIRKNSSFFFLSYRNNFGGTQKRVRISHGKRGIRVRAIDVDCIWFQNKLASFRHRDFIWFACFCYKLSIMVHWFSLQASTPAEQIFWIFFTIWK